MSSTITKRLVVAAVAVVLYFTLLMVVWATRPLEDAVPVGTDWSPTTAVSPKPQQLVSQRVECNTLFASEPRPDEPLPVLTPQPEGKPALEYQREPCALVHSDARRNFIVNTVAALGSLALIMFVAIRTRRTAVPPGLPAQSQQSRV